jgi:hypothetical protein
MTSGDCLVIERDDGRFDVFEIATNGAHLPVHRNISDSHTAWKIANAKLEPNGRDVYYKHESEPTSAVRLYRSN